VFTRPVTRAVTGRPYEYAMATIRSIGDLQSRYIEPRAGYWEKEAYRFVLERGPAWLALDSNTGLLEGTPSATDMGEAEVVVRVSTAYPDEVPEDSKSGREFQKRRKLAAHGLECTHRFVLSTVVQAQDAALR